MYTLYFMPDACSLATHVVLNELNQPVELIDKQQVSDFTALNPVGTVPVLLDGTQKLLEGAAIMLHILNKHPNAMLPSSGTARQQAIKNIMFANATVHPAYSKLFFIAHHISDENAKLDAFNAATETINNLWSVVESNLQHQDFLGGQKVSAADIMLTVYSRWGAHFPVDIQIGPRTQQMIDAVLAMPSFEAALAQEALKSAA